MKLYAYLTFIIFLVALGVVMLIHANVGLPPWDMFHIALSERTTLTIGMSAILTGLVCILIAYLLGVKPGFITLMDAVLIGLFIDLIIFLDFIPEQSTMFYGLVQLIVGLLLVSFGIASIYHVNMSFGPRDSLVIAVSRQLSLSQGISKLITEVLVFIIAFLLGGPFGVGTIVVALLVGVFIDVWAGIIKKLDKGEREEMPLV